MTAVSDSERRRAFLTWLRTGRLPALRTVGGLELKFNPWHDPEDGRFTFGGSGRNYGQSREGNLRVAVALAVAGLLRLSLGAMIRQSGGRSRAPL
ncbi:MAG: non-specific endonuclease family protein [Sphingomonadales bacterium]|nr:non-specific endonuclease family protein [Sphingomonadales bacterium]